MKVYTKSGDKGQTSLLGGTRIKKSDIRIHAYGTVDELNAQLGLVGDQEVNKERLPFLRRIQANLFTIGSHLAVDSNHDVNKLPTIEGLWVETLEHAIDAMDEELPMLKSFLLPGGHQSVSFCHGARCVCRRAERLVIELNEANAVDPTIITYLNRLSDYLFVLARKMSQELGVNEIPWKP